MKLHKTIVVSDVVPFLFFDSRIAALEAAFSPFPFPLFLDPLSAFTEYKNANTLCKASTKYTYTLHELNTKDVYRLC